MRYQLRRKLFLFVISFFILYSSSNAQIENLLKNLTGKNKSGEKTNNETVIAGLKEALEIGTGNAVSILSITDGYFQNELVKILLPENVQKVERLLRNIGMGKKLMNLYLA